MEKVGVIVNRVKTEVLRVKRGDTPIKYVGTTRSGGMSKILWSLDHVDGLIK